MENEGSIGLQDLIHKYLNNNCSKDELLRIVNLAKEDSDELRKALKTHWDSTSNDAMPDQDRWNSLYGAMMSKAKEIESVGAASETQVDSKLRRIGGRRKLMVRVAAAASVILVLTTALFFLLRKDEPQIVKGTPSVDPVQHIQPGGNKASLILANGSVINLDSVTNGTLAQQGGSKVIKIGDMVSYDAGSKSDEVVYNTIAVPKGGQYQLELADGPRVWLNSATTLRYPTAFVGKERMVEINGEAYFEVAHNNKQPFKVQKGDVEVQVLGTHFNVNAYDDEPSMKVTLLEGRVKVSRERDNESARFVYLNPGQQAVVAPAQENVTIANGVDVEEVIAWKTGMFLFKNTDLKSIMRQVQRWYDVEVVYHNDINETTSGGLPRSGNVSELMKIIEATGKVEFKIDGRKIFVRSK